MINEAATVLPNDMTPTASNPSSIYWAASASSFAYLFSLLTQTGIASVAMGMLSGFSAMPEQSLNTPFYPSMSLTDWDTGAPNARYWVLKLLAEHIKPGMNIHAAQRVSEESTEVFCAASDSRSGYPDLEFSCDDSEATLSIDFASFGTPSGVCGNYSVDPYCHAYSVQQYITRECNEKNACAVKVFPLPWLDPCKGYIETVRAQARCSVGKGRGSPVDSGDTSVLALEGSAGNVKNKTILVVNHRHEATTVSINAGHVLSAKMWVVDSETTTEGPTQITLSSLNNIQLGSFATAIISISN